MKKVEYHKGKLLFSVIAGIILIPFALMLLDADSRKFQLVGLIFIIFGPTLSLGASLKLFGEGIALRYDANNIYIEDMWKKQQARWSEVTGAGQYNQDIRVGGIFGIAQSNQYLYVDFKGGMFGKKRILLSHNFLKISKDELLKIAAELAAIYEYNQNEYASSNPMQVNMGQSINQPMANIKRPVQIKPAYQQPNHQPALNSLAGDRRADLMGTQAAKAGFGKKGL